MRRIVLGCLLFVYSFSSANTVSRDPVQEIVDEIIQVVGLKANFKIRAAAVPNAIAVSYEGERFVLYNPTFLQALTRSTGDKWAAVSVLAHEIGHHLNGHTLDNFGSLPGKELEADEFSGFVLRKMGASLDDAQAAIKIAGNYRASATHPPRSERLDAIAKGWTAGDPSLDNVIVFSSPEQSKKKREQETNMDARDAILLDPEYVWKKVDFPGDRSARYYITTQARLVRIEDNKLSIVGKMIALDDRNYSYFIRLANSKLLLIANDGKVLSEDGKWIGLLQS